MLRETRWLVAALAGALWVAPARAQASASDQGTGSAQAGSPSQEQRAQQGMSEKARAIEQQATSDVARTLAKLHAGNEVEIEAGTWMKEHATNDQVQDFATKMVDEHGEMDKDVMAFAEKHGIDLTSAPTPAEVKKGKQTVSLERLKGMRGAQADRAYMKMMVDDHTKDVKEARAAAQQAKKVNDTELAELLDKSAKTMEGHLEDAQKIQRDLSQRQARTPRAR